MTVANPWLPRASCDEGCMRAGAACRRDTKSRTPRIWLPGGPSPATGTDTQPVT